MYKIGKNILHIVREAFKVCLEGIAYMVWCIKHLFSVTSLTC